MEPRKASVSLLYNGVNVSAQIAPCLATFTYTDVASGESDSISCELTDRDRRWIGAWFPEKGDRLAPTILTTNWDGSGQTAFPCGVFRVDDFSFRGGPISLSLEGVAVPADSSFQSTKRTQTYENTTLQEIGQTIAGRAGISLFYEAGRVALEKVEQSNQSDCEFFDALVNKYGLVLKIYNDQLVVFSEDAYEKRPAKAILSEADFDTGWSWNSRQADTYTGVEYSYTNSEKDQTYSVELGGGDRILTCNEPAENMTEATLIAQAALNNANKGTVTMSIQMRARPGLIASDCVEITGLGRLSGKYYIDKITHSLGSGYRMALELRRIEERFSLPVTQSFSEVEKAKTIGGAPTAQETPQDSPGKGETYTLVSTKRGYYTAAEALAGAAIGGHPTGIVKAGTYYVFNTSQGMLNLTLVPGSPGSWINPDERGESNAGATAN